MIRPLLTGGDARATIITLLLGLPIIMLSLSLHELSHGFVAYKLGDGTAKAFGRLTLNPIKHLDPLGTVFMVFFGYGWAKPVPVNSRNLKKPKRDIALVSLAGPVSNILLAFVFAGIYVLMWSLFPEEVYFGLALKKASVTGIITLMSRLGIIYNVGLAIFNLIPLPPLDGSNILVSILPQKSAVKYLEVRKYTRYIFLGLVALSWAAPTLYSKLFVPFYWLCDNLIWLLCKPFELLLL